MGNRDLNSMSAAVREVIDAYPADHEFYGNQLKEDVVRIYPDAVNMYPDTILRMARRHRRYAFCVVDQNNSLYKKTAVKSIVEQIKELAPKQEIPIAQPAHVPERQGWLFSDQVFLVVFFVFALGAAFAFEAAFGRPLTPPSFIASKSASIYTPADPIYVYGFLPNRWSLLFTASEEIPNTWDIYSTVKGFFSIYNSLNHLSAVNQPPKGKMSKLLDILLHRCIAKKQKNCKFLKIFSPTLDNPLGRGYSLIYKCPNTWTLNKRLPEAPAAERPLIGAKGEFYERRTEKFSGMA
jgi:hypothetical protein